MEKTLGQVAQDAWYSTRPSSQDDWQAVADAVVAAHEARRWRPIETAPKDEWGVLAWVPTYYRGKGAVIKAIWLGGCWYDNLAHEVTPTRWSPIPAPPQEGE